MLIGDSDKDSDRDDHDSYTGGPGNDKIFADDDNRDLLIKYGPGRRDKALIDKRIDPRPTGCERVIRK